MVELFNPTATPVDVSQWFLSDDAGVPKKYRFPANTVIAPGGYLVLSETNFNATPGTNNSFAFGLRGDDVFLFSGTRTRTSLATVTVLRSTARQKE
jgi:hypothetical protein